MSGISLTLGQQCRKEIKDGGTKLLLLNCRVEDLNFDEFANPEKIKSISTGLQGNNQFTTLNDGVFEKFENLEELYLLGCGISEISAGAFRGMTKLRKLELSGNLIKKLDENLLAPLKNLEELSIINGMSFFTRNLVVENKNLRSLNLSGNIETKPGISRSENLTFLGYSGTECNYTKNKGYWEFTIDIKGIDKVDDDLERCYRIYEIYRLDMITRKSVPKNPRNLIVSSGQNRLNIAIYSSILILFLSFMIHL